MESWIYVLLSIEISIGVDWLMITMPTARGTYNHLCDIGNSTICSHFYLARTARCVWRITTLTKPSRRRCLKSTLWGRRGVRLYGARRQANRPPRTRLYGISIQFLGFSEPYWLDGYRHAKFEFEHTMTQTYDD